MFQITIIAHDVLDELVTRCATTGSHSGWSDPVGQTSGRNHFYPIGVDAQLNISGGQQIIPMYEGIDQDFANCISWIDGTFFTPHPIFENGCSASVPAHKVKALFNQACFY